MGQTRWSGRRADCCGLGVGRVMSVLCVSIGCAGGVFLGEEGVGEEGEGEGGAGGVEVVEGRFELGGGEGGRFVEAGEGGEGPGLCGERWWRIFAEVRGEALFEGREEVGVLGEGDDVV